VFGRENGRPLPTEPLATGQERRTRAQPNPLAARPIFDQSLRFKGSGNDSYIRIRNHKTLGHCGDYLFIVVRRNKKRAVQAFHLTCRSCRLWARTKFRMTIVPATSGALPIVNTGCE
jgi:hypothetical protein